MRLIDGDKLRTFGSINKGNFNSVETIQKWIDSEPTVKAIPIEWLKTQIKKCQEISNTSKTVGFAILAETIKQWEKENDR